MMRVLFVSRSGQWGLMAAAGMWVVAVGIGRAALEIDLSPTFPPTTVVVVELCVIVAATLLAIVTRPRFWEWDRVSRRGRARLLAGVVAAAVIGLAPFVSALFAGGITLVLWFAAAVVANLAPATWLPLAYYRGQESSWWVAAGLVLGAVVVHFFTCGMTAWAHRQFER